MARRSTLRTMLATALAVTLVGPVTPTAADPPRDGPTADDAASADSVGATDGLEVSYVPLDSRPFPTRTPVFLGQVGLAHVDAPPREWLGSFLEPGRAGQVADWWQASAATTDTSVVNVAMLTTGGLVASRECDSATTDEALTRLDVLQQVADDNPDHRILATHSIQRLASNLYGTPPGTYAGLVRDWGSLRDQVENLGHEHLRDELEAVAAQIPEDVRADHLCARARNQAINTALIDLVADGVVDRLVIGVDDAEEYGPHRVERLALQDHIDTSGVSDDVAIYVGTDVNGSLLMVGEVMRHAGLTPKVAVEYAGMPGEDWVAPYQDQPYAEVISTYVAELGGVMTTDPTQADVHLMANTPGPGDRNAFHDRVAALAAAGERVVLSDDVDPGVTDTKLYDAVTDRMQLAHLDGYSGWNVGAALSQGLARWSTLERASTGTVPGSDDPDVSTEAVLERLKESTTTHLAVLVEAFTHEHHYRNFVRAQVKAFAVDAGDDPQWFHFVHEDAQALAIAETKPRAEAMFDAEFAGAPVAVGVVDDTMEYTAATAVDGWEWGLPWPRYQELIATPDLAMSSRRSDFGSFARASVSPTSVHARPGATSLPPFTLTVGQAIGEPVTVTVTATSDVAELAEPVTVELDETTTSAAVPLELQATSTLPEGIHTIDVVIQQRRPNGATRTATVQVQIEVSIPNLALATRGVTAEADSVFSSYVPELAIDGDRTGIRSRWISDTDEPHHLTLTFPEPTTFDEVQLFQYAGYELYDYAIEARVDGTWQLLTDVVGNADAQTVHTYEPTTADALRLTVTDSRDTRARLYELEVYCRSSTCP